MSLLGISEIAASITSVINKFVPDANEADKNALALELARLQASTDLAKGQLSINAEEAKSENVFVSGARPFILWVCGVAFAYHFILQPLLAFVFAAAGYPVALPAFNMEALNTVMFGMLGLGGMRSFEKYKGVSR